MARSTAESTKRRLEFLTLSVPASFLDRSLTTRSQITATPLLPRRSDFDENQDFNGHLGVVYRTN